jgi:hypothetical protein
MVGEEFVGAMVTFLTNDVTAVRASATVVTAPDGHSRWLITRVGRLRSD